MGQQEGLETKVPSPEFDPQIHERGGDSQLLQAVKWSSDRHACIIMCVREHPRACTHTHTQNQ